MAEKGKLHLTIINRYYPPNHSVTGDSAFELAEFIKANSANIEVSSISVDAKYKNKEVEYETTDSTSYFIPSFYTKNNKLLRFFSSFIEGYRLVKKAIAIKSDVVIVMTDPPLLNFWAAKLLKETPWFLWSMDLYPEAFVSAKLASPSNPIIRYFQRVIHNNPPNYLIALGEQQRKYLNGKFDVQPKSFLLPCGIHNESKDSSIPVWKNDERITFAYAGNLGEAHSSRFLINFVKELDKEKHQIILALYGAKAEEAKKEIEAAPNVVFVDRVEKSEFDFIDVHLVSLLPEWTNVCVPSKAVSAICSAGTILFYGSENSDTYTMFKETSWTLPCQEIEKEEVQQIRNVFKQINKESIALKKDNSNLEKSNLNALKRKTFLEIVEELKTIKRH